MIVDLLSEQLVIGLMLSHNEALEYGLPTLAPEDFSSPNFSKLFSLMKDYRESGKDINPYTIQNGLKEYQISLSFNELIDIEDKFYLPEKFESLVSNVMDAKKRRSVVKDLNNITYRIQNDPTSLDAILEPLHHIEAESTVVKSLNNKNYIEVRSQHDQMKATQGFIPTYIQELDDTLTYKFARGEISIISSRPQNGKSTLKANLIKRQGEHGHGVCNMALEQTINVECDRIEALVSKIPGTEIARNYLWEKNDPRWEKLFEARKEIEKWNVHTIEGTGKTNIQVYNEMKFLKRNFGVEVFYFDLFDRLKEVSSAVSNKPQFISKAMTFYLEAAKQLDIHLCFLVQINRDAAKDKKNPRPSLHQLKEAGAYEEFARTVILLHYPKAWDPEMLHSNIEVNIAKQNNGKLRKFELGVDDSIMLLNSLDESSHSGVTSTVKPKIKKIGGQNANEQ